MAVRDTTADATWLRGHIPAEGRLLKPIAEPEVTMTAAHAPGDHHHSPGGTRQLMRVLQPAASSVLPDACLAATGDLLNIAKALSVRMAARSLRHRWSDDQLPADLAPPNAPQGRTLAGSMFEFCV
jgi:hypothetical protein